MPQGVVLVVEDDTLVRLEISDHLRSCGYQVIEAEDGESAVGILAGGVQVDLVFSDVEMPGPIDGLALARWAQEHRSGLPVVLTSGDEPAMKLAEDLCHQGLPIRKPYSAGLVATRVHSVLGDFGRDDSRRGAEPVQPGPSVGDSARAGPTDDRAFPTPESPSGVPAAADDGGPIP
jgi:CheY-like chemotaxis protein